MHLSGQVVDAYKKRISPVLSKMPRQSPPREQKNASTLGGVKNVQNKGYNAAPWSVAPNLNRQVESPISRPKRRPPLTSNQTYPNSSP